MSTSICHRAAGLPCYREAGWVHVYFGTIAGEVATAALLEDAWAAGKRVACPRIGSEGGLESREVRSLEDFVPGPMGLREPDPATAPLVDPEAIDVVVVPGIGYDREGHRLGFGAGFYDRFLATTGAERVALAFSLQLIERIPKGPGDEPVDWIVTEMEVIDCRPRKAARAEP